MIAELVKAGLGGFEEVELPDWLGELVEGAVEASNGLLIKGAGHKYIRRVPKAGGGWRYFYTVTGGHGLGHHSEMVRGSAFKIKDAGQEGHFHITEDHGDEVTLRHDETGKTSKVSKKALAAMLHAEHAEAVGKVRARVTANLEQAKKTGTNKQQERAAALVSKYGGVAERMEALPKTPTDIVRQKLHEHSFLVDEIVKQRQNLQKPLIADGEDAWEKYNAKWFDHDVLAKRSHHHKEVALLIGQDLVGDVLAVVLVVGT